MVKLTRSVKSRELLPALSLNGYRRKGMEMGEGTERERERVRERG